MKIIQVKTHKSYIIKKRSNNKVSFAEFILKEELNLYNKWQSDDLFHIIINENHPRGHRF